MRNFECAECGHTWSLPHGEGGLGSTLRCPECESRAVHRAAEDRGNRGARWGGRGSRMGAGPGGFGRGQGRRGGGRGRGGRW